MRVTSSGETDIKGVNAAVLNATRVIISSPLITERRDKEDAIEKLYIGSNPIITRGGVIEVMFDTGHIIPYIIPYRISSIVKKEEHSYILIVSERNKVTLYLTPLLCTPQHTDTTMLYHWYLINAYIHREYKNLLVLKYLFSSHETYLLTEKLFRAHPFYIGCVELDSYHTGYYYTIPDEYLSDVDAILNGQYSKVSDQLKHKAGLYYTDMELKKKVNSVLHKSEELRKELSKFLGVDLSPDMELDSKPVIENELIDSEV